MLDIDYRRVDGWDCVKGDELHPVTQALGFSAMSTGVDEITDSNWREAWMRVAMLERVFGPMLDEPIEPDAVKGHVGLRVNVRPMSRVQFRTRLDKNLRLQLERALK